MKKPSLIAIVGQTGSGKTALSLLLAKKYGGEVISADSRQVYRHLNIGTEKITKKETQGIPHHLLDVADPKRPYSVTRFTRDAKKALTSIIKREKLPLVVGGTGLYVDAFLLGKEFPLVPPNAQLRTQLEKKTTEELFSLLKKLDPRRAGTIDRHNPRRLVRAIEIATALGAVPKERKHSSPYRILWIGLSPDETQLKKRITTRLEKTLRRGLVTETKKLMKSGLSRKRLNELGLEYRLVASHLAGEITKKELREKLKKELLKYTKRQKTWFKTNKEIQWFKPEEKQKILKAVEEFLG